LNAGKSAVSCRRFETVGAEPAVPHSPDQTSKVLTGEFAERHNTIVKAGIEPIGRAATVETPARTAKTAPP
jgi:hypothetical protein